MPKFVNKSYRNFISLISLIGLTCVFIKYRINMTRKDAIERFAAMEGGKNFTIDSLSFAPKVEYSDSKDLNSKAKALLNNYIKADRLLHLTRKSKKD
ncbi:putative integral membrane protein [Theileria parva strain Muguga]|uniref:putative integral membrane protein n=1 Tax=Theileria parva strain Muguga TaxID=333668 RepID=UPI001C619151|nr:putative integral membrane protein [Theileria parva strain Muguga]KAF5153445.1 putative integral membrane protein [Theileria parva strain Muguga]